MGSSQSSSNQSQSNLPEEQRVPKDAGPKAERAYREALNEFWTDLREQPLSVLGLKYGGRFVADPRVQQLLQDPRWKQTFGEESVEAAQTIMGLIVRVGGPLVDVSPIQLFSAVRAHVALQGYTRSGGPHVEDEQVLGSPAPGMDFEYAKQWMPHAVAVYGRTLPRVMGIASLHQTKPLTSLTPEFTVSKITGVEAEDITSADWEGDTFHPGYYVAVDKARKAVVVAVRGTYRPKDVITDMVMHETPFECWLPGDHLGLRGEGWPETDEVLDEVNKPLRRSSKLKSMMWGSPPSAHVSQLELKKEQRASSKKEKRASKRASRKASKRVSSGLVETPDKCELNFIERFKTVAGLRPNNASSSSVQEESRGNRSSAASLGADNDETDNNNSLSDLFTVDNATHVAAQFGVATLHAADSVASWVSRKVQGERSRQDPTISGMAAFNARLFQVEEPPYPGLVHLHGKTHAGWLKAAQNLSNKIKNDVEEAVRLNPDYELVVTGHSMGATIATLLTLEWGANQNLNKARCYAFAAPGTLTLDMGRHPLVAERVCSVTLGNDFVSRFGLPNLLDLRETIVHLTKKMPGDWKERSFANAVLSGELEQEELEGIMASVEDEAMTHEKLFPAGTVWYLMPYEANASSSARRVDHAYFGEVLLKADMFTTHFRSLVTLSRLGGVDTTQIFDF